MPSVDFAFLMLLNMKSGANSCKTEKIVADEPTKLRYGCKAIEALVKLSCKKSIYFVKTFKKILT